MDSFQNGVCSVFFQTNSPFEHLLHAIPVGFPGAPLVLRTVKLSMVNPIANTPVGSSCSNRKCNDSTVTCVLILVFFRWGEAVASLTLMLSTTFVSNVCHQELCPPSSFAVLAAATAYHCESEFGPQLIKGHITIYCFIAASSLFLLDSSMRNFSAFCKSFR